MKLLMLIITISVIVSNCSKEENLTQTDNSSSANTSDNPSSDDTKVGFQRVYIVGSAVKKKCIQYECEKEKAVLWDLGGNMTELNNACVPVDATSHGESIYIAGESNYCVVD